MTERTRAGDFAWIPEQTTVLGADNDYPEEGPARTVTVAGFWIQTHQVTNTEFAEFVSATNYLTVAERPLNPADYPGAPPQNLQPGSMVFHRTPGPVDLRHISQWWTWTPGACWNHPRGPRSSLKGRDRHPVVHIAFEDAAAYAEWAGCALPTEAQWEVAARGGLRAATYTWGEAPESAGEKLANYWHGEFPYLPDTGYGQTAPVGSYPPNGYGLFDMAGNVWEWTDTRYRAMLCRRQLRSRAAAVRRAPQGDQGRFFSVRRFLLHALPPRGASTPTRRHRHEPYRLPLYRRRIVRTRRRPVPGVLCWTCSDRRRRYGATHREPAHRP